LSAALVDFVLYRIALGAQPLIADGSLTSEQVRHALAQRRKELASENPARLAADALAKLPASAFVKV
jgi:hypothetical protein